MNYSIYLSIKFRILKVTLGTAKFEGTLYVDLSDGFKVKFVEHNNPVPPEAHKVYDDRGIKFFVWA